MNNPVVKKQKIMGEGWVGGFSKGGKRKLGSDEDDEHGRTLGLGNIEVSEKELERGTTWRDGGW